MIKKLFGFLVIGLLMVSAIILSACTSPDGEKTFETGKTVSAEEARIIAEDFINDFLMMEGTSVSVRNHGVAYDMYHLKVSVEAEETIDSFITKDGRLFFPQHLDIEEIKSMDPFAMEEEIPQVDPPKSARPVVEMFVMTYCPFGTQIQKGVLPVLEVIGDDIDFSQKYVDYAMQDKKELNENLLQYCIEREDYHEFIAYLECFLAAENQSDNCFNQLINQPNNIYDCMEETDKEFKITENYENNIDWRGSFPSFNIHQEEVRKYGVSGSPALVINGQSIPAPRDSASLLEIICDAFEEKPEGCKAELSDVPPSPGFGFEGSGSNTTAACG